MTLTTECKEHEWFFYGLGEICLKCAKLKNVKKILSIKDIKRGLAK